MTRKTGFYEPTEIEHPTQTLFFFTKTAGRDNLDEVIVIYSPPILYGDWRCQRPVTSTNIFAILAAIFDFTKN